MKTMILTVALATCAIAVTGCGSTPSAAPSIAAGAASLEAARSAGAPELDAVDLNEARNKLEKARALATAGDDRGAMRMAEQADVDAQLARAKAGSERSRLAVVELETGLQTLRDELNRAAAKQATRPMR
ncbi:MAG: hypothetical protein CFE40_05100 [Burkholderiales bacterium PBB1]|nr:MAG: hypothetical protein CFE40_05100 [Burkholderiales bacterium PBB1]